MYRGGSEDIDVFDRKKSRPSNLYVRGFYFTDSEAHAKQYGNVQEYYLNITNPLGNENNISKKQIVKLLQAIEDDGEDMDLSNYGYGATFDSIAKSVMGVDDFTKLYDISNTAVGDLVKTVELFIELNGTNYDGFILSTETVVFNSNQIKKVSNTNPTSNPDVRYSINSINDFRNKTNEELEHIQQEFLNSNKNNLFAFHKYLKAIDFMDASREEKLRRAKLVKDELTNSIFDKRTYYYQEFVDVYNNNEYETWNEYRKIRTAIQEEERKKHAQQLDISKKEAFSERGVQFAIRCKCFF